MVQPRDEDSCCLELPDFPVIFLQLDRSSFQQDSECSAVVLSDTGRRHTIRKIDKNPPLEGKILPKTHWEQPETNSAS